jgi:hypothetical protein
MADAWWRAPAVRTACIILVGAGGAWGAHTACAAYQARRTPSCSWPPTHITEADLAYSPDARAGEATATFTPSPVDSTYVLLAIRYANGARESAGLINMVAMGDASVWRMSIGPG